jgi:hypothetical protein
MARENKRKRDEKRFGKPERLADIVATAPRVLPNTIPKEKVKNYKDHCDNIIQDILEAKVIQATNVVNYFYATRRARDFDWSKDIPCWMPPFPSMFIESDRPIAYFGGDPLPAAFPQRWGCMIRQMFIDKDIAREKFQKGFSNEDHFIVSHDGAFGISIKAPGLPGTHCYLYISLVELRPEGMIDIDGVSTVVPLDVNGHQMEEPRFSPGYTTSSHHEEEIRTLDWVKMLAAPLLLALSFMNCKNVVLSSHQPDKDLNKERKKSKLRPFVRFHTINIEPAKKMLNQEGEIETNGLQKALHICRGHFKTWTTSYMGRPLERPVTYWAPSHVKGSAKHGVVISDYDVKAPGQPPTRGQ